MAFNSSLRCLHKTFNFAPLWRASQAVFPKTFKSSFYAMKNYGPQKIISGAANLNNCGQIWDNLLQQNLVFLWLFVTWFLKLNPTKVSILPLLKPDMLKDKNFLGPRGRRGLVVFVSARQSKGPGFKSRARIQKIFIVEKISLC